jgi:hypothetical protein
MDQITSDAQLLKKELEAYGFRVQLMNEKQRTIYYYEHFKLLGLMLSEKLLHMIKLRICKYQCKDLVSSILVTPVKREDGKIEMDKKAERSLPWAYQAGLSPQIPSALTYLLFSRYNHMLPDEIHQVPDLPDNIVT